MAMTFVDAGADFSADGLYRWAWWREMAPDLYESGPVETALWLLHNPSTANGEEEDPTTRRVLDFSRRWGCLRAVVMNRLAYCATDPGALRRAVVAGIDIEGAANPAIIDAALRRQPRYVIAAWGGGISLGYARDDDGRYLEHYEPSIRAPDPETLLGSLWADGTLIHALRLNRDGSPAHPLYVPISAAPERPRTVAELREEASA